MIICEITLHLTFLINTISKKNITSESVNYTMIYQNVYIMKKTFSIPIDVQLQFSCNSSTATLSFTIVNHPTTGKSNKAFHRTTSKSKHFLLLHCGNNKCIKSEQMKHKIQNMTTASIAHQYHIHTNILSKHCCNVSLWLIFIK